MARPGGARDLTTGDHFAIAADRPVERSIGACSTPAPRHPPAVSFAMRAPRTPLADESVALGLVVVNRLARPDFVNAAARRVTGGDPRHPADTDRATNAELLDRLAITTSHPEWIVRRTCGTDRSWQCHRGQQTSRRGSPRRVADNRPAEVTIAARWSSPPSSWRPARWHPVVATAWQLTGGDWRDRGCARWPGSRPGCRVAGRRTAPGGRASKRGAGRRTGNAVRDRHALVPAAGRLFAVLARAEGADLVANETVPHCADLVRQTCGRSWSPLGRTARRSPCGSGTGARSGQTTPHTCGCWWMRALAGEARRRLRAGGATERSGDAGLQRQLFISALTLLPRGWSLYATAVRHLAETSFVVSERVSRRPDIEQPMPA